MKKPILKGPKLIAVGPLKCFKGGGGGSSGGGGGGSRGGGGKGGGGSSSGTKTGSGSKGGGPASSGPSALSGKNPKPKGEEKSEGYSGPSLGLGDDKTKDAQSFVSSNRGGESGGYTGPSLGIAGGKYKSVEADEADYEGGGGWQGDDEEQAAKERDARQQAVRDATKRQEEMAAEAASREAGKKAEEDARQQAIDVASIEKTKKSMAQAIKERDKALAAERSPFAKQLAGVDVDKAVEAQEQRRIGEETSPYSRLAKEMDLGQEIEDQAMLREAEEDVRMAKEVSPFSKQISPDMIQKMQQEQQDALDAGESLRQFRIREQEAKEQDAEDRELKEGAESERREDLAAQEVEKAKRFEEQLASDPRFGSLEEFKEAKLQKEIADTRQARMDEQNLMEEQNPFGKQLKGEGFDFQKAIADRELSQDLERQDEIRRKDARERALLEKEASPFSKQLEGVDIEAAEAAEFDRYKAKAKAERAERKRLEADPRFGSQEEFEAFKDQQKKEADQAEDVERYSEWEKSVRDRQAEMDRKKGAIDKETFEEFTGKEDVGPGVKTKIVDGVKTKVVETAEGKILDTAGNLINMIPGVGLVNSLSKMVGGPDLVKKALQKTGVEGVVKSGVRGAVDKVTPDEEPTPTTFGEALESMQKEEGDFKAVTKPFKGDKSSGAGALALGLGAAAAAKALQPKDKPAEPAPAAEPAKGEATDVEGEKSKLMEDLKKQASGEESLAEKQVRRTQDRSLAQRLAALKSMRGQDAGTKLRSFSKASDRARREAEGQIEIAGMKERRSAQDQLRAQLNKMSDDEARERWRKIDRDDRQRLMKMNREDAIKKGEFNKWLTVIAMGQKLFPDQIKAAGGFIGDNVLSPVWEGGKKIVSGVGDFIGDVFSAEGGYISGPGTETSDSIPARLSDGEFVVKASAVRGLGKELGAKGKGDEREKGVDFLYNLQDKMDKKAEGGEVSKFDQEYNLADEKRKMFMNHLKKKNIPYNQKERNFFNEWGKGEPRESIEDFKETYQSYYAKGGEAYVRPKKAFREAIGYEPESRFHDKAEKDAKFGGARRKFRHFQQGGAVSLGVKGLKPQFNVPQSQGYGSVIAAQKDLDRRLADLERQLGR